ncbi:hypothetical protein AUEXF2481DRAFT_29175 [Aureobasidium subglaciale EXF-2481]|uniref:Uncharacterized protein n=1 Tax=Aureobasidium subglaciale (strain EXF-2481) TaxID=1043005 RepID=A0A074YI66_AURSE|nr:uncharacterized protein AUEXF2481DRAFT_29175 [Aureobasidium subglaciale EXF-2481]KEQ95754.1 hypothetical protein AUEXF2481DRAFT_29175 [Aureobasidium subglaciale EXF-2481]
MHLYGRIWHILKSGRSSQGGHAFIANAGISGGSILDIAFPKDLPEDADLVQPGTREVDVNLTGTYYTTVLALHYFKKTHDTSDGFKKHLVLMSSWRDIAKTLSHQRTWLASSVCVDCESLSDTKKMLSDSHSAHN